jgi:hypothetical protein
MRGGTRRRRGHADGGPVGDQQLRAYPGQQPRLCPDTREDLVRDHYREAGGAWSSHAAGQFRKPARRNRSLRPHGASLISEGRGGLVQWQ